ncbi:hypothetical protein IAU59_003875 [Kwoniella sp. CBS 9459]
MYDVDPNDTTDTRDDTSDRAPLLSTKDQPTDSSRETALTGRGVSRAVTSSNVSSGFPGISGLSPSPFNKHVCHRMFEPTASGESAESGRPVTSCQDCVAASNEFFSGRSKGHTVIPEDPVQDPYQEAAKIRGWARRPSTSNNSKSSILGRFLK